MIISSISLENIFYKFFDIVWEWINNIYNIVVCFFILFFHFVYIIFQFLLLELLHACLIFLILLLSSYLQFVKTVKSQLSKRSSQAPLRVVIFTETAIGLLRLPDILEECQRASDATLVFEGVVFGSDDFCASIGKIQCSQINQSIEKKIIITPSTHSRAMFSGDWE